MNVGISPRIFRPLILLGAILLASCPVHAEAPASSKKITAVLQPFVASHAVAGAVTLVANKDKILSVDAVGFADIASGKQMRPDSMFWIASQTKPITATGLMILVDEGKVNVDDPVEKFLPEFKDQWLAVEKDKDHILLKKPSRPITVRDVLTHTSGLPFISVMEKPTMDLLPLRDSAASYAMTPLQTEPGAKWQYSNAGINIAGRIIEVVSAMPYEEFMDKRLFEPLGMTDTTFWPNDEQQARVAKVYKPNAAKDDLEGSTIAQLKYPLSDRKRQPMPAGGLFSTAPDVGRFCQMILNGGTFNGKRYLSEAAVKQMTTKQTPDAVKPPWGLGWATATNGTYGHGGALSTNMSIDPARGLITVFLVQHAGFPKNGGQAQNAFRKAAEEEFGSK